MIARVKADWDAIEPHYRAGIKSLKDIGAEFGVSDAAIVKHARNNGWDRNLKAKIQAKADAKVSAAMVSAEVSESKALTEKARVEIESEVQARIRLEHRANIGRGRKVAMSLLMELEAQTGEENVSMLHELGELMRRDDDKGQDKLNDLYQKVISLPTRTKTMKDLADTLRSLIDKERQAFGIDAGGGGDGTFESAIAAALAQ